MTVWQRYINTSVCDGLCWDAAVISTAQQQLLCAHQGGILAKVTEPEIQVLLSRKRDVLLTQGLTLGGLKCLVIRDNLYTEAHQFAMDLRTKIYGDNSSRAIAVVLANPVCLILIGRKGIPGGILGMKAFQTAWQWLLGRPKIRVWSINGHMVEQVTCFKYLGMLLQSLGERSAYHEYVAKLAQRLAQAILIFFWTNGRQYIPAALKLFQAKIISQLL
uniref:Uncharacterized protein n=1 Tax=Varanus komodoensis TaxID=61221 RepID=A0A8D2LAP6_VARKO